MSRRFTAYAYEQSTGFSDTERVPDEPAALARVEHSFPIRWETFQDDLHREHGFVDFLIVDDFTTYNLWDDLLAKGIARVGIRPEGFVTLESSTSNNLPEGKWRMLHAMRPLAADELYARGGVTKPCSTKLPAVYCLMHGQPTGTCIFNVRLDAAVEFIKRKIATFGGAHDDL